MSDPTDNKAWADFTPYTKNDTDLAEDSNIFSACFGPKSKKSTQVNDMDTEKQKLVDNQDQSNSILDQPDTSKL